MANKEGAEEFPTEDQEVIAMFAAQAALVISNARRYRDELRARTDLETLVDTSPVGVVVFDARTGMPMSFNREARRIVEILRTPDHPPETASRGADDSPRRRRGDLPGRVSTGPGSERR